MSRAAERRETTAYRVLISTGRGGYGPKVGWDADWPTREAAEACAARARRQDGRMAGRPGSSRSRLPRCPPRG